MELNDLTSKDMEYLIDSYIHDEVHRNILKRRLLDHVKYESLAEEFHYSVRQVKRIVYKEQDILYSKIGSAEQSADFSFCVIAER